MMHAVTKRQLAIDFVVAALVVLPLLGLDLVFGSLTFRAGLWAWAIVLGVGLIAVIGFRHWSPSLVLVFAVGLAAVHTLVLRESVWAVWFSILLPLATLGRRWRTIAELLIGGAVVVVASVLVGVGIFNLTFAWSDPGEDVLPVAYILGVFPALVLFSLAMLTGVVVRLIGQNAKETRQRQIAQANAAHFQQLQAIQEERTTIAREMHDVVAHSLAVVMAQANGARYASDVAAKDESLKNIAETSRGALTDVRGLLHQLRHSQAADPQTGLAEVPELVERMRGAGMEVQVELPPRRPEVSRPTELAAYRLVQESLTNAMRHGRKDAPVYVRLVDQGESLVLDVHNRPRSTAPTPEGHGVTGMRERVALLGGKSWIGQEDGWFRVHAVLPKGRPA